MPADPQGLSSDLGRRTRTLPPVYVAIAVLSMGTLHLVVPVSRIIPVPWNLLGLLPLACGLTLNVIADRAFRRARARFDQDWLDYRRHVRRWI